MPTIRFDAGLPALVFLPSYRRKLFFLLLRSDALKNPR